MSQMNRSFLWPYDNNFTNYYFCIFWRKKYFISFGFFGRLFPNNHRNMFCRFHVSLINGFPLPKTRKCQIFGKVVLIKKGQSRHIPWNLLYFQPEIFCKIYRCEVFFTFWHAWCLIGLLKWTSMWSKLQILFFSRNFFKCSLLFIVCTERMLLCILT